MDKYLRLMLAKDPLGKPVVVTAPSHVLVFAGDMVSVKGEKLFTVEKETITAADSDEMDVLKAVATVYDAEAVYRNKWNREDGDGENS